MALTRFKGMLALALMSTALAPAPVSAHHSSNQFDMARRIQVKGIVRRFQWANPHIKLFVEASVAGKTELWAFVGNSPNVLNRAGWTSSAVKEGQKISVTTSPARDGSKTGLLMAVKLENGRELSGFPVEGDGGPGGAGIGGARPAVPPVTKYN